MTGTLICIVLEKTPLRYVDVILLDEAQDTNAITAQFVSMQRAEGSAVVLVGDSHQNIYGFSAATNYIDQCLQFEESRVYALTNPFGFLNRLPTWPRIS